MIGLSKQVVVPKVGVTGDGHGIESGITPGSANKNEALLRAGRLAVYCQGAGPGR